jgi:hypothetical protein
MHNFVITMKTGTQSFQVLMDSRLRGSDSISDLRSRPVSLFFLSPSHTSFRAVAQSCRSRFDHITSKQRIMPMPRHRPLRTISKQKNGRRKCFVEDVEGVVMEGNQMAGRNRVCFVRYLPVSQCSERGSTEPLPHLPIKERPPTSL